MRPHRHKGSPLRWPASQRTRPTTRSSSVAAARGARVVVPPAKTATALGRGPLEARDRTIRMGRTDDDSGRRHRATIGRLERRTPSSGTNRSSTVRFELAVQEGRWLRHSSHATSASDDRPGRARLVCHPLVRARGWGLIVAGSKSIHAPTPRGGATEIVLPSRWLVNGSRYVVRRPGTTTKMIPATSTPAPKSGGSATPLRSLVCTFSGPASTTVSRSRQKIPPHQQTNAFSLISWTGSAHRLQTSFADRSQPAVIRCPAAVRAGTRAPEGGRRRSALM